MSLNINEKSMRKRCRNLLPFFVLIILEIEFKFSESVECAKTIVLMGGRTHAAQKSGNSRKEENPKLSGPSSHSLSDVKIVKKKIRKIMQKANQNGTQMKAQMPKRV